MLSLDLTNIYPFISQDELNGMEDEISKSIQTVYERTGAGNDFLGWLDLPVSMDKETLEEIESISNELRKEIDFLVVIGIGGSYLGTRAVSEALKPNFPVKSEVNPVLIYAGQQIGEDYLHDLLLFLKDKEYAICVISKSGTTTEPALAFRLLKDHLVEITGKEKAGKRIIAITDENKGALRQLTEKEGYRSFVIPDDVGGRFSVLTPVGLVPLAVAGINIRDLLSGAEEMRAKTGKDIPFSENPAALYAAARNSLYRRDKFIEILVNYDPKLHYLSEWWKQLYGESEGKDNKGIFPASVDFTTDLHSMGQYIQEGRRELFETVISIKGAQNKLLVPSDPEDLDKLNYLAGKRIDEVNKMAELGTRIAHVEGGVPNIKIEIDSLDENHLGQLIYFFEMACAVSGYTLEINPFNQPGVEAYKRNMFALLGKPGFEKETTEIKKKVNPEF
jgi:glucose-6-phosphate isomerase